MPSIYIGIDIGTSGAKAVAIRSSQEVVPSVRYAYRLLDNSDEQIRELDFADVRTGFEYCLRSVLDSLSQEKVGGLCLSTAMHSVIGLDKDFLPVTNVITWADMRGRSFLTGPQRYPDRDELIRHTGTPLHPMSPLLKIKYLNQEGRSDIPYFADLKSYLIHLLTGQWYLDRSLASATGLWDANTSQWYGPALAYAGIDGFQLPRIVDTEYVFDKWKWNGRSYGIPLVIGASDGCLSNYTVLGEQTSAANLTLGTSGALRINLPTYTPRRHENLFCYYLREGHWVLGGATNNAGNLLSVPLEEFPVEKTEVEYPVFLPHHFGERSPFMRFESKSGFYTQKELTEEEKKELIREGLLFNLRRIKEQLEDESGSAFQTIYLTGGLSNDDKIIALAPHILNCPVEKADLPDSSALGAALLGRRAVGGKEVSFNFGTERFEPDTKRVEHYQKYYEIFKRLLLP